MNVQNINNLANQLKNLGFANLNYVLAKRICFRPKAFCLPYRFEKGEYILHFQLSFVKAGQSGDYALRFYDTAFLKAASIEQTPVGFDVGKLSQKMSQIDWRIAFDFTEQKTVVSADKAVFEKEQIIESIVDELEVLEASPEGKRVAAHLKTTHWAGSAYHEVFGVLGLQKVKAEVNQRFYVIEGEPGITVEEAFRYLQNRWLEKEMLTRKRQASETATTTAASEKGSGFLRKKRNRRTRISKAEK